MIMRKTRLAGAAAIVLAALLASAGCSTDTSPVRSNSSTVRILERPQGPNGKPASLTASATVSATVGATLEVGDDNGLGKTVLIVPAGAVDTPTLITMDATTAGPIFVELGPEGTVFNPDHPVTLQISFQGADLTGIDASTINVYYNNTSAGTWDRIDVSVSNPDGATVTAPLAHFSEYAPGSEE